MYQKVLTTAIVFLLIFTSCKEIKKEKTKKLITQTEKLTKLSFQNKAHELVYNVVQKVGNYQKLRSKKDVVYTYNYTTPDDKTDISTEKYIFNGELSYGKYEKHQRTLPQLTGIIEQGYDGNEYWLKNNEQLITDTKSLKRVMFSRPTNFYWFTMFQKLLDPGLNYEYVGEKSIDNNNYDIVKVSFESKNDKPTDIYQLYINQKTKLVDQFLFTVADFGVMKTPLLMQIKYEEIDGFLIPSKRKYKKSTWNAEITKAPWTLVNWTNIKFNNDLTINDFSK